MNEPILYEVKPNETLSNIAEKIGMTENQLRDFHNSNCGKFGLLLFNNFIGIQKLIIPKDYKSPENIWKEITESLPPKMITEEIYTDIYQVIESFEEIGEEKNEYEYLFEIKLRKDKIKEKDVWIAETQQSNFIKNKEKPDKKTSSIGLACMEAISPLHLELSNKGGIIAVSPTQNSEERFKSKRNEIEEFFTDDISKEYLNRFQHELVNEKFLLNKLCTTLLYQLMFPKLEQFWSYQIFTRQIFVMLNSFPVQCEFLAQHEINEDEITIRFSGKIIEKCTLSELLLNIRNEDEDEANFLNGEINFTYIYNSKLKKITNAEAEISLLNEEDLYIKHQINISQNE